MSLATPEMRDFAERLIAYETKINKSSEIKIPAACLVIGNLRPHLATLMGDVGFHALLSRALTLANAKVTWLRAVHVKEDGTFNGFNEVEAEIGSDEIFEGCVVLVAQLLGLLAAFVGNDLTLRLVHEAWPKLPLNDLDFGKGL